MFSQAPPTTWFYLRKSHLGKVSNAMLSSAAAPMSQMPGASKIRNLFMRFLVSPASPNS